MECARLQSRNAFGHELRPAVNQPRAFCAVLYRPTGNLIVIILVGLAQVSGVSERYRAFEAHPMQRRAGIEAAGERDSDALLDGKIFENGGHDGIIRLRADVLAYTAGSRLRLEHPKG